MTPRSAISSRSSVCMRLLAVGLGTLAFGAGSGAVQAAPLDVLASVSLGDELGGRPVALGVLDDGSVVLGGMDDHGATVVRLDASGFLAVPLGRLPGTLEDLAVDTGTGTIAVVVGDALVVLGPDLEVSWRVPLAARSEQEALRHVAVGELGTVAVAAAGELYVFAADGHLLGRAALPHETTTGLAVLDAHDLVVTTGASTLTCNGRDVAELQGFARDGSLRWQAYGQAPDPEHCDALAASRGIDVARGSDGLLYLLAEVDGRGHDGRLQRSPTETAFHDVFHGPKGHPANNVAFDAATTRDDVEPPRFAYYARFSPAGEHLLGQYFLLPDEEALVHPTAIAADEHGNVHLVGTTTHRLEEIDEASAEVAVTEELLAPSGFYQVVHADFDARTVWRQLEREHASTHVPALALAGDSAVTLLDATSDANATDTSPHRVRTDATPHDGPAVLVWPPAPQGKIMPDKKPARDEVGTFGYESGLAGSDPSCNCDAGRTAAPPSFLLLALLALGLAPRRP
jgi:MYXO-CTERM domain-containing protein